MCKICRWKTRWYSTYSRKCSSFDPFNTRSHSSCSMFHFQTWKKLPARGTMGPAVLERAYMYYDFVKIFKLVFLTVSRACAARRQSCRQKQFKKCAIVQLCCRQEHTSAPVLSTKLSKCSCATALSRKPPKCSRAAVLSPKAPKGSCAAMLPPTHPSSAVLSPTISKCSCEAVLSPNASKCRRDLCSCHSTFCKFQEGYIVLRSWSRGVSHLQEWSLVNDNYQKASMFGLSKDWTHQIYIENIFTNNSKKIMYRKYRRNNHISKVLYKSYFQSRKYTNRSLRPDKAFICRVNILLGEDLSPGIFVLRATIVLYNLLFQWFLIRNFIYLCPLSFMSISK